MGRLQSATQTARHSGITRRLHGDIHRRVRGFVREYNWPKKIIADVAYIRGKPMRNRKCVGRLASLPRHTYDFHASEAHLAPSL